MDFRHRWNNNWRLLIAPNPTQFTILPIFEELFFEKESEK